jgi:hypothetical protein
LGVPREKNSRFARQYPKKAFLQPAVIIWNREGRKVFEWFLKPSILNLGGAIFRMAPPEILIEVRKSLGIS